VTSLFLAQVANNRVGYAAPGTGILRCVIRLHRRSELQIPCQAQGTPQLLAEALSRWHCTALAQAARSCDNLAQCHSIAARW
jgi:hypothetical protein